LEGIFKTEKEWKNFSDREMEEYVEAVFNYYREYGFPYFEYDLDKNRKKFKDLVLSIERNGFFAGDIIKQYMVGLDLAWSYFPHVWNIRQGNCLTPMEVFNNDELFKQAIQRRIKLGDAINDNMIRKILCIFKNTKRVSNFRPTAASAIYKRLGGGVVYDPSCGFGGRLLGATATRCVTKYIGTDPSIKTFEGLKQMVRDLGDLFFSEVELYNLGSEDLKLPSNTVDIVFTSPPYFNTELYADEPTQSCIKFPEYSSWLEGYFRQTIINSYDCLKPDGWLVINIANTKQLKYLTEDTKSIILDCGFILVDTWRLTLSQVSKTTGYKYEPIFIFRKGE